jgi:hypothetical protein
MKRQQSAGICDAEMHYHSCLCTVSPGIGQLNSVVKQLDYAIISLIFWRKVKDFGLIQIDRIAEVASMTILVLEALHPFSIEQISIL